MKRRDFIGAAIAALVVPFGFLKAEKLGDKVGYLNLSSQSIQPLADPKNVILVLRALQNKKVAEKFEKAGKQIDVEEICRMVCENSGWKNFYSLVKK